MYVECFHVVESCTFCLLFLSFSLSLSPLPSPPLPSPPLPSPTEFLVERAEKHGGSVQYATYLELEQAYAKEEIYPLDLKNAVARELSMVCTLLGNSVWYRIHMSCRFGFRSREAIYHVLLHVCLFCEQLLEPIQKKFLSDPEAQRIRDCGYPDEGALSSSPALQGHSVCCNIACTQRSKFVPSVHTCTLYECFL